MMKVVAWFCRDMRRRRILRIRVLNNGVVWNCCLRLVGRLGKRQLDLDGWSGGPSIRQA